MRELIVLPEELVVGLRSNKSHPCTAAQFSPKFLQAGAEMKREKKTKHTPRIELN